MGGYSEQHRFIFPVSETALAAANVLIAWTVIKPLTIYRVSFLVTTALGTFTGTAPELTINDGASGTEFVTITLVASSAAGTETIGTAVSSLLPRAIHDGDVLEFEVETAGSGGTTTGAGYFVLYMTEDSDGSL